MRQKTYRTEALCLCSCKSLATDCTATNDTKQYFIISLNSISYFSFFEKVRCHETINRRTQRRTNLGTKGYKKSKKMPRYRRQSMRERSADLHNPICHWSSNRTTLQNVQRNIYIYMYTSRIFTWEYTRDAVRLNAILLHKPSRTHNTTLTLSLWGWASKCAYAN